jgi:hypothetical protein
MKTIIAFLLLSSVAFAAEPKPTSALVEERAGLVVKMEALQKQFEANANEFGKTPAAVAFAEKQNKLREQFGELEGKLKAIDAAIVENATKEKKK